MKEGVGEERAGDLEAVEVRQAGPLLTECLKEKPIVRRCGEEHSICEAKRSEESSGSNAGAGVAARAALDDSKDTGI